MNEEQKNFIKSNIDKIRSNADIAQKKSPFGQKYEILAATKTRTPEEINFAISCRIKHIGENRVQELLEKYESIDKKDIKIHFIGHLQTNKVKYIVDKVDMIHSVDSIKLAKEIDKHCERIGKRMDVLCEINIGEESSKSGVKLENAEDFIREIAKLKNLSFKGMMIIPPKITDIDKQKQFFQKIMNFYIDISRKKIDNIDCNVISMGMSEDYEPAIECGSNMIRLGTAIFGQRI